MMSGGDSKRATFVMVNDILASGHKTFADYYNDRPDFNDHMLHINLVEENVYGG
jgi:hypothetical protein